MNKIQDTFSKFTSFNLFQTVKSVEAIALIFPVNDIPIYCE